MYKTNPCWSCDCYDEDMGCTMPSIDKAYACPLEEKKTTEFFIAMIPPTVTYQQHKVKVVNNKPMFYDSPELHDARMKLCAYLGQRKPKQRYECGVRLTVKWLFPKGEHHVDGEYRITKPDTDNLQKLLKDCMTACNFWKDDALVCSEIVEKFWASTPGIYIKIEEM